MKMPLGMVFASTAIALLPVCALADSNVIGFWDFKGGTVGADAGTVTSSLGQWTGTANKAHATMGTLPTYSSACPDAVIFTDATRSEVLVENPHSLHFSLANNSLGGYVDITGLSTELTAHTAFTIEFFARLDDASGNPWTEPLVFRTADRYVSVSLGQGANSGQYDNVNKFKFNYLGIDLLNPAGTTAFAHTILDHWIQIAFVYEQTDAESHSGNLKCYVDRSLKTTIAYTNTPLGEVAQPLRLGTSFGNNRVANQPYNFRGDICALRIKSVALDKSGFMLRKYSVPQGAMLGFWDFKDGEVGASATSVTNKGCLTSVGTGAGYAISNSSNDAGKVPEFSDDIPGRYIYPSSERGQRLVDNPQSILFTTQAGSGTLSEQSLSVGGGKILFPELASAITAQSSYTIECFFKDEDWSEWQWASGLFGFYANLENGTMVNVDAMVSSVKSDKAAWDLTLPSPINAKYNKNSTWKDGKWHHIAVVYDGSVSNISLYVDYHLGQTVAYTNYYRDSEKFVLGSHAQERATYAFRGKVSCLRIVPTALEIADFMTATDRLPGFVLIVR